MAKRISVINFKGGVGKTTLAFNLAAGLVRYYDDTRVLLIDMDHQSSLSIICVGGQRWQQAVQAGQTVNAIFENFVGQSNQFPDESLILTNVLRRFRYRGLDLVPASLELDDLEIELTATHHGNPIQSEWNKRTLICRWLEETSADSTYDYIIFDCPPATKIVAQNAVAASHGYLIPVVPEAVMERGAPHLARLVQNGIDGRLNALAAMNKQYSTYVSNTQLIGVAITRIAVSGRAASGYTNDHTAHLNSLRRVWNADLLEPYVVQGTGVGETLTAGVPVYDRATTQNIGKRGIHRQYRNLVDAIKNRVDAL